MDQSVSRELTPGYRLPVRLDFDAHPAAIHWQASDGARFVEPFFDDTLRRLRVAMGRDAGAASPLDTWNDAPPPVTPDAVIFHISRCGSTLVSRMLAALPSTLAISEAPVLDDILRGARRDTASQSAMRERWLRHALAAFTASQATRPSRIVIKLDCWHLFEIERVRRAFPGTPLLFVYRDPLEVLVSLLERPSLTLVRDTVTPEEIGIARAERDALSQTELAAAILGAFFREATRQRAHLTPVPYDSLPDGALTALGRAQFTAGEIDLMRRASAADAKAPHRPFVPDSVRKRAEAGRAIQDACARWTTPAFQAWCATRPGEGASA